MRQLILQKMERLCSRWVGQFLFQGDGDFIWTWWDTVQIYVNLLLFILILVCVLGIWVRVLCHSQEKTKKIPQRVMAFGISLIFFIQMDDGVTESHCAGPEDNHPRYRNPPLLEDGSTAPELSLRPPTGSAAGLEAGTSASINPIPDQIEKDQIIKQCKEQMFRSWQREPRITKRMLQPATRGISIENHICNFLINRWQHASLNDIRAEKDELLTNKGESYCYLGWRRFIEDT